MHRGRFGGNARKRKAKLTDATFQAMIGRPGPAEAAIATIDAGVDVESAEAPTGGARIAARVALTRPAPGHAQERAFRCQDYHFGYTVCRHCHSDQAFYVHHADLEQGYTFRCRICRQELTIGLEN